MRWLFLLVAIGYGSLVRAQTAPSPGASPVPLARGPLLKRAPDPSRWLVSVASGLADPTRPAKDTKFDLRMMVAKSGPIRCVVSVTSDGHRTEKWCEGGLQATIFPGVQEPSISTRSTTSRGNEGYSDYSKTDFPGFEWISAKNYIGAQTMEGVPCIVFHDGPVSLNAAAATTDGTAAAPPVPKTGRTAYIASDGRLPVLLQDENVTTFYQFETPPAAPLTLPPNVQAAFDLIHARLEEAAAPPAAP